MFMYVSIEMKRLNIIHQLFEGKTMHIIKNKDNNFCYSLGSKYPIEFC